MRTALSSLIHSSGSIPFMYHMHRCLFRNIYSIITLPKPPSNNCFCYNGEGFRGVHRHTGYAKQTGNMNEILASPATWILIGINIILFIVEERAGGSTDTEVALQFGAQTLPALRRKEYYRLFTAMFLHFGIMHLVCNMYSLYNLGPAIEWIYGWWRFLIIYLGAGICGNLLTWVVESKTGRNGISAGASGAIFGLMGAYIALALIPEIRDHLSIRSIVITLAINVIYGFSSRRINMTAHFGGLIGGFMIAGMMVLGWVK